MGRPKKWTVDHIPEEGDIDEENVTWGPGKCKRGGCNREYANLRLHFRDCHVNTPRCKVTFLQMEIPEVGDVPPEEVYSGTGRCNRVGCKKDFVNLREHYEVHLGLKSECEVCGKIVAKGTLRLHVLTHTGPVKCSMCDKKAVSERAFKTHRNKYHPGVKEATAIPLTEEEAAEFHLAKQESHQRSEMRRTGRQTIPQLKSTLMDYDRRLRDPEDELKLWERAADLQERFQTLFDFEDDAIISFNASFVSVWNRDWKIPRLVFEVIHKTSVYEIFEASDFFPDPKVGTLTQPNRNDYALSGKHRGHLASAGDFHEMMMAAPTYYYSNVVPFTDVFNLVVRQPLENHIRETAEEHSEVLAIHFPMMDGPTQTIGLNRVRVPPFVGTVMMVEKIDGCHITGWKLHNTNDIYDYRHCIRDPFALLDEAGIRVRFRREDFAFVSQYEEAGA